ncbi:MULTISPECIES: pitrilysin family protein [unclassified Polaromonas]|uniref:M16 family metallopeptidase n=1 Tax=unclassified Polaromonas TaxID=2638319 RepID=UPI000F083722|nr:MULTISPECIES: pitrilysin family protein [unclassified Polaromonas]AYQ26942.1 insulinase family protein [Polaromonas sp. SP1]QGJ18211.1 insulinase family protein [Polaromonas sp. Pch-P]
MMIAIKKRATSLILALATGIFCLNFQAGALAAIPIQHWTQAGGAQVYLVESPAIAMVDVQIDFDAGTRRDPAAQAGLASMVAIMLDKGLEAKNGAPAMDENTLSEAWADLGAQFGASATGERLGFSLRSLTDPELLDKAVALAARQIAEPSFPGAIWQRERERMVASLKESYTRPGSIIARAYAKAVYGTHPYGYEVTEATLSRISIADMRAFHTAGVVACRARISMVGAVTRAQADAIAARLLSRLPQVPCAGLPSMPQVPEVAPLAQAEEKRIPFDSAQAHVLMGQPGFKRDDPDYFPLTVGNYILGGGGFVSRLTLEVREKRGLTYGVYSYFSPGLHAGSFTVGLQTRPDQAGQAVTLVRDVVKDFVTQGPTETELKAAKDNLIGGFALRIDSNRKLLDNIASIAWNGLPLDYLDTWTQQVDKVTVADIKAAFARKLQPEKMVTVILGAAP